MSNKKILKKAVQKAFDSAWNDPFGIKKHDMKYGVDDYEWSVSDYHIMVRLPGTDHYMHDMYYPIEQFIYDHDFAKALWGEKKLPELNFNDEMTEAEAYKEYFRWLTEPVNSLDWRYHLQQMVISEDPIKYIGENI